MRKYHNTVSLHVTSNSWVTAQIRQKVVFNFATSKSISVADPFQVASGIAQIQVHYLASEHTHTHITRFVLVSFCACDKHDDQKQCQKGKDWFGDYRDHH